MSSAIRQFRDAMQQHGLAPKEVIPDGKVHRFDTQKRGKKDGWYVLYGDGVPAGSFGCWRSGLSKKWCSKSTKEMTATERAEYAQRMDEIKAARKAEEAERHRRAAAKAVQIWERSTPAADDHPYLKRKGVNAHGLRMDGDRLVVPVRVDGDLTSLQYIAPDGGKRFLTGGKISGGYHSIAGDNPADMGRIFIVEGYATAATVRAATGGHVAVAFNAGNLKPVAMAIRAKLPDALIVIAADHDRNTEGNPGLTKGREAAAAVGGVVVFPTFADDDQGSDWNDYAALHGLDAVRDSITSQVNETTQQATESAPEQADNAEGEQSPVDGEGDDGLPPLPFGYSCNRHGVFIESSDKEPEQVTHRPVRVEALSRDTSRDNWGRLVCWMDHDGHQHERAIPAGMFHSNGGELAQELATSGLPIIPGKERKLLQYLAAFTPETRLTAATATGWHGDAFVMPDKTINEPEGERIIYQSTEYRADGCMGSSGVLDDWQSLVADVSSLVRFAIACSLSAPLRLLTNTAAGGFHFYGRTSHGKTTMLQAAASVWGNGADPALSGGADVFIQRWNATRNGLEGMAASFNDLPLIVDEIGENDGREFGRIVYQVMSGTGKARANRSGGLSKRRAWRITLLSSGELPVSEFIEGVKGGQLVRLVDIEAANMFSGREDADRMKHGCAKCYGVAGIALLESGNLLEGVEGITAEKIGEAPTPEAGRVRDRFKLVAHTGELAIRRGILPWPVGAVLESCQQVSAGWKACGHGMSDADRGIANVRNFLLAYGTSRFEYESGGKVPTDRAGWFRDDRYHFTDNAFKEACGGVLPKVVQKALRDAGLLHQSDAKKMKARVMVGGSHIYLTSVKSAIVSGNEKQEGKQGNEGNRHINKGVEGCPHAKGKEGKQGKQQNPLPTVAHSENGNGQSANPYATTGLPTLPTLPTQKQLVNGDTSDIHKNKQWEMTI